MSYCVTGLSPAPFRPLFGLSDADLTLRGVRRYQVDTCPGFPCRIEMRDARPGETVLLLNHLYQPAQTPYRASHAIYVNEQAVAAYDRVNDIPEVMRLRLLSLRAYDSDHMMVDADVTPGTEVEALIERLFLDPSVSYIHAHNARQGCYSGRIDRA